MIKTHSNLMIRIAIKDLLKKHGMTYRDLGQSIKMREGSVKQLMTRGQFTIDRIELIAQKFGLSLLEFLEIAYSKQQGPTQLTTTQEDLLIEDPVSIHLMFLLGSGFTFSQAKERLQADDRKIQRALRTLDKAGIVELHADGKIFVKLRAPYRFNKSGIIEKKLRPGYLDFLISQIAKRPSPETLQRTFELYVSESLFAQMKLEINQIIQKYANHSRLEVEVDDKRRTFPITGLFLLKELDGWGQYIRSLR